MHIHFIGIGGIGVSALAKFYFFKGHKVSGSDLVESEIVNDLRKMGVKIYIGHQKENLSKDVDSVIYSNAIPKTNPELLAAKRSGIKTQTYAENLGKLTKEYFTIAVSGTHGKSTTTAMVALILEKAGLDPTVIIGTKVREWGNSNFRPGKSRYLVIEGDEYKAAFLNYWPKIIVLTNIEEEHLDYYRDIKHIISTFQKYVSHLSKDGILVVNKDDFVLEKYFLKSFGLLSKSAELRKFAYLRAKIRREGKRGEPGTFKKYFSDHYKPYSFAQPETQKLKQILKAPGEHNISNALAALAAARALKIPDKISFRALSRFRGVWRRFEYRKKYKGALIFDDYGHHPTEIKATLRAAREFMKSKNINGNLWCVFQPHQLQRTNLLFKDFVKSFDEADRIIILDVFGVAGREKFQSVEKNIAEKLAKQIEKRKKWVEHIPTISMTAEYLRKNLGKGDLAILMGAGDIYSTNI